MGNNTSNNKEPVESQRKLQKEPQGLRIVSLGKTGAGKSHTGNTILCDPTAFQTKRSSNSVTQTCQTVTATVKGRTIKYTDTPGYFDTSRSEDELRSEILKSIIHCDPYPHGFLILLKVDTYTGQEEEIVKKITETFGEVALKYAVVLFTHGDDLDDDQTIEEFVGENQELQKLVEKCDGRCHVIDNKYWNRQIDGYRSNRVQIESLMNTIEEMVRKNGERHYNELQDEVQRHIDNEIEVVRAEPNARWSEKQVRKEAEERVHTKLMVRLAGVATGVLLGALLGVLDCMKSVLTCISEKEASLVHNAVTSAVKGGLTGYDAVEGQQTVNEAIHKVIDKQLNSEKP